MMKTSNRFTARSVFPFCMVFYPSQFATFSFRQPASGNAVLQRKNIHGKNRKDPKNRNATIGRKSVSKCGLASCAHTYMHSAWRKAAMSAVSSLALAPGLESVYCQLAGGRV
ncbi:unnamed protein product [Calypogeia fissa]